jgi:hypothetical protein
LTEIKFYAAGFHVLGVSVETELPAAVRILAENGFASVEPDSSAFEKSGAEIQLYAEAGIA